MKKKTIEEQYSRPLFVLIVKRERRTKNLNVWIFLQKLSKIFFKRRIVGDAIASRTGSNGVHIDSRLLKLIVVRIFTFNRTNWSIETQKLDKFISPLILL